MLDMGFIHDVRRIVAKVPTKRQTLLFSATMPAEIRKLADTILRQPVTVAVTPVSSTVEKIEQSLYFVEKRNKPLLLAHLVETLPMSRALVFSRTKHGADRVVRQLHARGIRAEAIHATPAVPSTGQGSAISGTRRPGARRIAPRRPSPSARTSPRSSAATTSRPGTAATTCSWTTGSPNAPIRAGGSISRRTPRARSAPDRRPATSTTSTRRSCSGSSARRARASSTSCSPLASGSTRCSSAIGGR